MVADILENLKNFDVLKKALRDLLALGIMARILDAENLSLAGQRRLRIERGPVDLVAEFDANQLNTDRIQAVE